MLAEGALAESPDRGSRRSTKRDADTPHLDTRIQRPESLDDPLNSSREGDLLGQQSGSKRLKSASLNSAEFESRALGKPRE